MYWYAHALDIDMDVGSSLIKPDLPMVLAHFLCAKASPTPAQRLDMVWIWACCGCGMDMGVM